MKALSGGVTAFLVLAALAALYSGTAVAQPAQQESPIVWQGHGSEHIDGCETGFHWVLSPGGGITEVMLHTEMNGTVQDPIAMMQSGASGQGAWHANTTLVDLEEGDTPWVTFNGTAHGSTSVKISHCLDEDEADLPDGGDEPVGDGNGNETDDGEDRGQTDDGVECIGPEDINAVTSGEDILVSWTAFSGADGYHLYRQEGDGEWMLHTSTDENTTSFLDDTVEVGTTYSYEVTASVDGNETEACDQATVTAIPVFPGVVGAVLASALGLTAYGVTRRRS